MPSYWHPIGHFLTNSNLNWLKFGWLDDWFLHMPSLCWHGNRPLACSRTNCSAPSKAHLPANIYIVQWLVIGMLFIPNPSGTIITSKWRPSPYNIGNAWPILIAYCLNARIEAYHWPNGCGHELSSFAATLADGMAAYSVVSHKARQR